MNNHFTHLHLHTDFSLLDGAISIERLVAFGKTQQWKALAITDHGNIFGAVKFFQKCQKEGIKPILGIETYFTENAAVKDIDKKYYHLILLVQNQIGYKNLCKLISFAYQKGFYFKPRIDYALLQEHAEGLIATSACLGGHIPQLLKAQQMQLAYEKIDWFMRVFGPERFYLEVQPADQAEQKVLNEQLFAIGKERGIQLVATGDCHYISPEDHEAHEIMLAIQTHDVMSNPDRYTFGDCRVPIRTTQQMLDCFKDHEDAVWNTGKIADQCNFTFETGKLFFPKFQIPDNKTPEEYFTYLCQRGLETLITQQRIDPSHRAIYQARLDEEVQLITKMGFVGYFLVVSDFIQWSRRNGIPVGPGRGSAAGSLAAWTLEITNIDPLKYNLLFERFLNPERISMPDIDIDFCIEGRENVIKYVRDKYGHDKVCQIITFGTMMAKGVIKDVARALGFAFEDSNAITSLVPEQLKITLEEAVEQEVRLKELIANNPKAKKLFDIAHRLEGLTRHASKHAAGIVISPEAIDEVLPVYVPPKTTELVTQYAMTELEYLGFLKIDLLGLKNLTLIDRAITMIQQNHGITINIDMLPLDDLPTFQLLCAGKTSGVFQLESEGLKEVLRKLQPEKFEDIIAVNALYRPGPLGSGMVDDFIERKHGRQKITYLFKELEPILEETYGVIVYQEQVMKIASAIAGYSLGQSDILRRAMGKKKPEEMAKQRELFLNGAHERNFDTQKAGELFDLMAYFAGYGFNKSHSAAYGLIAYQTAYLKANYPAEFMACLISLEVTNADKMAFYLQEAKDMELDIIPPDINRSHINFTVSEGKIIFGLQGIKSVGLASLENICAERSKKPFVDLLDFCTRIDLRTSNKRVIEHLIYAGAFDTLPGHRAQQYTELARIIEQASEQKLAAQTGQLGLFAKKTNTAEPEPYVFQPLAPWTNKEQLEKEQEVIGFYLSAHPLQTYRHQISLLCPTPCADIIKTMQTYNSQQEPLALVCGLLKSKKDIITKKGDRMAFLQLEDESGTAEIILFPNTFKKAERWLIDEHHVFVVKGAVDLTSPQKCKIKADECIPIEQVLQEWSTITKVSFMLPHLFTQETLSALDEYLVAGKSIMELIFHENGKQISVIANKKITIDEEMINELYKKDIGVKLWL